jgi:mono/diheme cytochrome c family protein
MAFVHPAGLLTFVAAAILMSACARPERDEPKVVGGDADRGRVALVAHECGACHRIPGIPGARGTVGPPLGDLRDRLYIAGQLPNEPDRVVGWIVDAPAHDPRTAMPDLAVSEAEARDIAAYLYR